MLTNGSEDGLLAAEIWRAQAALEKRCGAASDERIALGKARALFIEAGAWQQVAAVDAALRRLS
jgi:hypothetical protein